MRQTGGRGRAHRRVCYDRLAVSICAERAKVVRISQGGCFSSSSCCCVPPSCDVIGGEMSTMRLQAR